MKKSNTPVYWEGDNLQYLAVSGKNANNDFFTTQTAHPISGRNLDFICDTMSAQDIGQLMGGN